MKTHIIFIFLVIFSSTVSAEDYVRESWFEYPDPSTAPKITTVCSQVGSADVPCPTWDKPFRTCTKSTCTGYTTTTELLRVNPTFVMSGPPSAEESVRVAVTAIVAACATKAITGAKATAAATPSPEPTARVGAALVAGVGLFKACIGEASAAAVVTGILNQIEFKIETPTHWAKL